MLIRELAEMREVREGVSKVKGKRKGERVRERERESRRK